MIKPLQGQTILITRPQQQSQSLVLAVAAQGGKSIILPMMAIIDCVDSAKLEQQLNHLHQYDIAIFLSANAVTAVQSRWAKAHNLVVIAIGGGTARALATAGIRVDHMPLQHDSEGILQLPCLQLIHSKRIIIFCGENPRPLLQQILRQRGAEVEAAICYRRHSLKYTEIEWRNALQQATTVVCTSQEGLHNLLTALTSELMLLLQQRQLLVISERMRTYAKEQGLTATVAIGASDEAIIAALQTIL